MDQAYLRTIEQNMGNGMPDDTLAQMFKIDPKTITYIREKRDKRRKIKPKGKNAEEKKARVKERFLR